MIALLVWLVLGLAPSAEPTAEEAAWIDAVTALGYDAGVFVDDETSLRTWGMVWDAFNPADRGGSR